MWFHLSSVFSLGHGDDKLKAALETFQFCCANKDILNFTEQMERFCDEFLQLARAVSVSFKNELSKAQENY